MPVKYSKWITREQLSQDRDTLYVFGDNLERRGYGGQAKEMRGEPNAIGVATKHKPTMDENAFFTDEDIMTVIRDMKEVEARFYNGGYHSICIPSDGIGTGLSELHTRAPLVYEYINQILYSFWPKRFGIYPTAENLARVENYKPSQELKDLLERRHR